MAHQIAFKGGENLKRALKDIERRTGSAKTVSVGFMANAKYSDGTPVAMVAAIHNFGAPARGIPARPFFSNMVEEKSPSWGDTLGEYLKRTQFSARLSLGFMGEEIAGDLRESIIHGGWANNSERTKRAKGFDAALIDTGKMLNSVTYQVDDGEEKA